MPAGEGAPGRTIEEVLSDLARDATKGHRHRNQEERLRLVEERLERLETKGPAIKRIVALEAAVEELTRRLQAAESSGADRLRRIEGKLNALETDSKRAGSGQTFNALAGKVEDLAERVEAVEDGLWRGPLPPEPEPEAADA